jgi:acyl carrier protein
MDVLNAIKGILTSEVLVEVAADRMTLDDSLRDLYGLDSLGFVELRVQCEEIFDVVISDDDFAPDNFTTLGGVVALLERLVAAKDKTPVA